MTQPMLEVESAVKAFGTVTALSGVDLAVPPGQIAALLGPNGAGKTTLVRIVATLVRPDAGVIRVDGYDVVTDPYAVRARIGLTGQYAGLDEALPGRANLTLIGRLAGLRRRAAQERAAGLIDRFDLAAAARPAGRHLLRRHAPPRRPGRQPDGPPVPAGPGRAHHRAGPGRAAAALGIAGRAARRGHVHAAHHPVPGGSRAARRRRAHPGPGPDGGQRHPGPAARPDRDPAGRGPVRAAGLAVAAARALAARLGLAPDSLHADPAAGRVTVAARDGVGTLLDVARALAADGLAVADLGLRGPTLDEAFLALTGQHPHPVPPP